MASLVGIDQYYVYENRLASFLGQRSVVQRRASNTSSRAPKTTTWPHKFLPPFELAKAGFYFDPHPSNPDNVTCFLCHKQLDGWEPADNPIEEHLKHSPNCGWAVTAAVEAEYDGLEQVDPRESRLLEARKATFAGRWPYESKKGWKCKTKQLAEAGWIYTPTNESDDNTTCAYCQLALDGWEATDKPIDEHYKRAADCPFFELVNSRPPPKKTRAKGARGSKASRTSMQSVATAASDLTTITDAPADYEDSVLTTTSVMTQSSKKTIRTRKAPAAAKPRKARTKKEEAVQVHEDVEVLEVDMPPFPPPKPARGRKRTSDAMEELASVNVEAPAPKKRATRTRGSQNPDASTLSASLQAENELAEGSGRPKAPSGRKRAATATSTKGSKARKASAVSVASAASTASLRRAKLPDDEELDRQLEMDLDRPLSDDDLGNDSGLRQAREPIETKAKAKVKKTAVKRGAKQDVQKQEVRSADYDMFDPVPPPPDEAAIEADLEMLEAEESISRGEGALPVAKGPRKPGMRKVSKQTRKGKDSLADAELVEPAVGMPASGSGLDSGVDDGSPSAQLSAEIEVFHDASEVPELSTTNTVVENEAPPKRGRGRPRKSNESRASTGSSQGRVSGDVGSEQLSNKEEKAQDSKAQAVASRDKQPLASRQAVTASPLPQSQRGLVVAAALSPGAAEQTPRLGPPATPSAKQAVLSPSQSPQSSDAENQPPSSKPAASSSSKRPSLGGDGGASVEKRRRDAASTPIRTGSPSKRVHAGNGRVMGGLQSATPWAAVDLDLIFSNHDGSIMADGEGGLGKENGGSGPVQRFLGKSGELATPERQMTVEEWIYHNASRAEQKLRHECEALVSSFEKEGTRAMRVLENLVVE